LEAPDQHSVSIPVRGAYSFSLGFLASNEH
jgi:hypothetical protein